MRGGVPPPPPHLASHAGVKAKRIETPAVRGKPEINPRHCRRCCFCGPRFGARRRGQSRRRPPASCVVFPAKISSREKTLVFGLGGCLLGRLSRFGSVGEGGGVGGEKG